MTANSASSFSLRSILNASALVFAASMVLSVGGFAFHALASRRLGVSDYGALYALISVYTLAIIPVTLATPVIAKYSAEFSALHDDSHVRGLIDLLVRAFAALGVAYVLGATVFSNQLGTFLHMPAWEIPIVGVMAAIGILSGALRAIGQGVHDYAGYGLSMTGEGIAKIVVLIGVSFFGLTIFRSACSFAMSLTVGALFIFVPLIRRYYKIAASRILLDWRRIFATASGAASLTLTMTFMGFADVLIVKHVFDSHQAGLYSAASLSARILLYFVSFVPAILIPQATHRHARGERTRMTLLLASVFVAFVSFVGVVAYRFGGLILLHALTGSAFDAALPLLGPYAGAMAFLALTNTLGSYAIATHRLAFVTPLIISTVGTLVYIAIVHPSLLAVADEMLIGNFLMLLALAIPLGVEGFRNLRA